MSENLLCDTQLIDWLISIIVEIPGRAFYEFVDGLCHELYLISKYLYIKLVVIVFIKRGSRVEKDFFMSEFNGIAIAKGGGELVSYLRVFCKKRVFELWVFGTLDP